MQQLIQQLAVKQGVTKEQAAGILFTIKEFVEENFPAFEHSLDEVFANDAVSEQNIAVQELSKKDYASDSYPLYTLFKRKAV